MSRFIRNDDFARPRNAAVALAIVALALGVLVALRALSGEAARMPSPGERIEVLALNASAPLVVYSEFGFDSDTVWAANPDRPGDRTAIAQVPHAYSYGVIPSLSPDGSRLAVAVLSEGERSVSGKNAQLLIIDVASGASSVMAQDIDLSEPVWSPAGDAVAVRRVTSTSGAFGKTEIVRVAIEGSTTTVMRSEGQLFPVDFSPDGQDVYAARISSAGTDISVAGSTGVRQIARLSDEVARDWQLSPDGRQLAYVAPGPSALMSAWTVDLTSGDSRVALPGRGGAQLSPQWEANGGLTVGVLEGGSDAPARLAGNGRPLAASNLPVPRGFDVPLSWSPGGRDLAVRGFSNASLTDPGASWIFVVGTDGSRLKLSENSDVIVAGWLPAETLP